MRLVRAPSAEREGTPGEEVVSEGPLRAPAPKPADGVWRLAEVGPRSSPTTPKGVPSEAYLVRRLRDAGEQI